MSKYIKNTVPKVQSLRFGMQILFALLCVWIGFEFSMYIGFLASGGAQGNPVKPAGAEGFLPISALMSFYYFVQSGVIHGVHPAAFIIFVAIVSVSFLVGKSFCSWLCPVGLISELIGDFGEKIFGIIKLPRFLDIFFRSFKYLLLWFFASSIFSMSATALNAFLNSPYNIIADVKLYDFFVQMSRTAIIILTLLVVFSLVIRNFWCRYLCPYGALLGITALLSPLKIRRNAQTCIDCSLCSKVCPARIKVDKKITVISDECTSCMQCLDICPVKDTLELKTSAKATGVAKHAAAIIIAGTFLLLTGLGIATGNWKGNVPKERMIELYNNREFIGHGTE